VLNRFRLGADPWALAFLAVGISGFAAALEAWCAWLKRGYEVSWTLANNFNLDLGVAPAWQLIVPGLLIALAVAVRQQVARMSEATSGVSSPKDPHVAALMRAPAVRSVSAGGDQTASAAR
jgi:hypothetical protein